MPQISATTNGQKYTKRLNRFEEEGFSPKENLRVKRIRAPDTTNPIAMSHGAKLPKTSK